MGPFVNRTWIRILSWAVALLIAGLNAWLLVQDLPLTRSVFNLY